LDPSEIWVSGGTGISLNLTQLDSGFHDSNSDRNVSNLYLIFYKFFSEKAENFAEWGQKDRKSRMGIRKGSGMGSGKIAHLDTLCYNINL